MLTLPSSLRSILFSCAAITALAMSAGIAAEPSRYMGGPVELATAPNGAIVNAKILNINPPIKYAKPTIERLTEGVWSIGGYSIVNVTVIEGNDGLIVYDTGDTREEGKQLREAIKTISNKPIKVIIYSHSHYSKGAGELVSNPADVTIIGHPKVNATIATGGGGVASSIPELGPALTARTFVQFNNFLPDTGPDAATGSRISVGAPTAFLPANTIPRDGETLNLLGIKLQFFNAYISDDYSLTVYLPDRGIVLNNFFWPGPPNFYTLRGGEYRDPMQWRDGLKVIRDLEPELLINTHARPIKGKAEVARRLAAYMDLITLIYDQTLRGILAGFGPDDLKHALYIPAHMQAVPETTEIYGEIVHFPEAIYQHAIGWFDGDTTKLFALPPHDEAERMVKLIGGQTKVLAAAQQALNDKEFAWCAQLVQYVYRLNPNDAPTKQLKAQLLRQMAYRTTGSIARAFLLTEARALEGAVNYPHVLPPRPAAVAATPSTYVDYFRVRIDPRKSERTDKVLQFKFRNKPEQNAALHIRRGIAEYVAHPDSYRHKPDITLDLTTDTWANLYLNKTEIADAIEKREVLVGGDAAELTKIFAMFDRL